LAQPGGSPAKYWRSLDQLHRTPRFLQALHREFPPDATEIEVSRRSFLGLLGASTALAGATLSGCIRKPAEEILPYAKRPEDLVPGRPRFYATAAAVCGQVEGLLVESQEGRPTKIEGNPEHPASQGATTAWAQAEVLTLYDPDRSREPLRRGKPSTWREWDNFATTHLAQHEETGGEGVALLCEDLPSPTFHGLLAEFARRFPKARLHVHDAAALPNTRSGAILVGSRGRPTFHGLERAKVILALDSDFLGSEGNTISNARKFARGRRITDTRARMNRLYVVEPFFTVTGTMADHRLRLRGSKVPELLGALVAELVRQGLKLPDGADRILPRLSPTERKEGAKRRREVGPAGPEGRRKYVQAAARDLLRNRGRGLVIVGERQAPAVHGLGHLLNAALGNLGHGAIATISHDPERPELRSLEQLAADLGKGRVRLLVILGGNPAFTAHADLGFADLVGRVPESVHLGLHVDETAKRCSWHLPRSHFLEAWGDLRAQDRTGTVTIQQPLIAPLHGTRSELELLAQLAGSSTLRGYELVRVHWAKKAIGDFDTKWHRWLHDGLAPQVSEASHTMPGKWDALIAAWPPPAPPSETLELTFRLDPKLYDGRYANNGWLQELPDPVTKLTWDNAACLGPATASRLGVKSFDLVELTSGGRTLRLPAFVVPGTADDAVVVSLGYGRTQGGSVLKDAGADAYRLRTTRAPWFARVALEKAGRRRLLASTQDHGSMEGRPIVREGTLAQFRKDPEFARKAVKHPPLRSIWTEPNPKSSPQWGMCVDLNACTGCNACVVACQAENNIPVVGRRRVLEGREMHWVRVDRYFSGPPEDPTGMVTQPMMCHHCELAPCEGVCPVAATVHSPEGLNDMAYNRCIGTRYCSNNCPYKVRRFNFFQYNGDIDPVSRMQKNPDVTVRFRGVMEKCTFCVQRINAARIAAKRDGDGRIPDGEIEPACAQACPSRAIVFGDVADLSSEVSRQGRQARAYTVLSEINVKPRLTYLAKLRNPNPELG
jgi:molybdopterin-containing oxidoreductase family iron-sulfur binding subunit